MGEDVATDPAEKAPAAPAAPPAPQLKLSSILPMVAMLGLQKFDLEALGYVHHVEVAYIIVQVVCLGSLYLIYMRITAEPDGGGKIKIPAVTQFGKEVKPASEQTPKEYDMAKFKEELQKAVMGPIILGGIYYKWRTLLPLVMQALMLPLQLYEAPLFQIYVMNKKGITRPFPAENPFGLPQAPPAPAEAVTESAAVELKEGDRVRIHGLKSQQELNGEEGVLVAYDEDQTRWRVKTSTSGEVFRLKVDNLELATSEPQVKDADEKKAD